jgi:hypothetical protein
MQVPILPTMGKDTTYQADPHKDAHQSKQIKQLCHKRNQDLAKRFFPLSIILSREAKKTNPRKQKTHILVQVTL